MTFAEAQDACRKGAYAGIGFVFSADDPYLGVDLDDCRDAGTGQIAAWAQVIITNLHTYTEVSPSGTGVKLLLRATKPGPRTRPTKSDARHIEVYDTQHYFALTGQHLAGTPTTVEARQTELSALYTEAIEPTRPRGDGPNRANRPSRRLTARSLSQASSASVSDDQGLLRKAKTSKNGAKFTRLWEGDTSDVQDDVSAADLSLCRLLAYWTAKDAERIDRLFRQSGLYQLPGRAEKWDTVHFADGSTYGQMTIAKAIADQREVYVRGARDDRRTIIPHPWQQATETPHVRDATRRRLAAHIQEQVRTYLDAPNGELLAVTAPPGSGKSTAVAELGMARDLAYIAERHDLVDSISALPFFHHIQPPSAENCPYYRAHDLVAHKGFNTLGWHAGHGCAYSRQFSAGGSTLYMVEHVPTRHVTKHQDGIIVDELNLTKWLPEHKFTQSDLRAALLAVTAGSDAERLLQTVDLALVDAARQAGSTPYPAPLHGRALFAALDKRCGGGLAELVGKLAEGGDDVLNPDERSRPRC